MYSIGIDLVEIRRIAISTKNDKFLEKYFSNSERKLFLKSNCKINYERIAGNFAAKEAFSKAVKTGIVGFKLSDISVLRKENGSPYIVLSGKAKELFNDKYNFDVSITHTDELAQAVVIAVEK